MFTDDGDDAVGADLNECWRPNAAAPEAVGAFDLRQRAGGRQMGAVYTRPAPTINRRRGKRNLGYAHCS
ncbi:hypothetical protein M8494_11775 [Serratia ureilytica]